MGLARFIFFYSIFAVFVVASTDDAARITLLCGHVSCRSEAHPQTRRIFPCPDREKVLAAIGRPRESLAGFFDGVEEEHLMVKNAIAAVGGAADTGYGPLARAVLWEELAALIQKKVGHPVSESYRGIVDEKEIYIFQGTKHFEGQVYVLVMLHDGRVLSGRVDPIDDIASWGARLGDLRQISPHPQP